MLETDTVNKRSDDQGILSTPEVQGKGIEGSDHGMYEKADNDPKPTVHGQEPVPRKEQTKEPKQTPVKGPEEKDPVKKSEEKAPVKESGSSHS